MCFFTLCIDHKRAKWFLTILAVLSLLLSGVGMYLTILIYESEVWHYIDESGSDYLRQLFPIIFLLCGIAFITSMLMSMVSRLNTKVFNLAFGLISLPISLFFIGLGSFLIGFYGSSQTVISKLCSGEEGFYYADYS